jgi:hypothetical protein
VPGHHSYDVLAKADAAGVSTICFFVDPGDTRFTMLAEGSASSDGLAFTMNATGVVSTSFAASLSCVAGGGTMTIDEDFGRTVNFTRIDALADGTAGVARTSRASGRLLPTGR